MSRGLVYVLVLWMWPGAAIRGKGFTRKGRAGRVLCLFCSSKAVGPTCVDYEPRRVGPDGKL
jgi:hypothetical protein